MLWLLCAVAKLAVGDKIVGTIDRQVTYYGGVAEWYVEELLTKPPEQMTREDLFALSGLYSALGDIEPVSAGL